MEANQRRNGGDERLLRVLNIVYFLSWNGKMEQPHLITVHNQHNNAIHLRDFKRRLSELRGRELPESFAWSYKRRYKTGYIWKDVTDDDVIIPTANREYVLKGSLLLSANKITQQIKEREEAKPLASSAASKSPLSRSHIEDKCSEKPTKVGKESSIEILEPSSSSKERSKEILAPTSSSKERPIEISAPTSSSKERPIEILAPTSSSKERPIEILAPTSSSKEPSIEVLAPTSSSGSEKADRRRTAAFKADEWWEDIKRLMMVENDMTFNGVRRDKDDGNSAGKRGTVMSNWLNCGFNGVRRKKGDGNSAGKWRSSMSNLLNCRAVETSDSVIRVARNESGRRV